MGAVVRMEPVKDPLQRARLTLFGGKTRPWMIYHACEVLAASPFDDDRDRAARCIGLLKERLRWDAQRLEPAPGPEGRPTEDARTDESGSGMSLAAASSVAAARLAMTFTAGWLVGALWQVLS